MLLVGTSLSLQQRGAGHRRWQPRELVSCVRVQGFSLKALKHLVLDEADRLLNMDFEAEIDQILRVIPRERRTQLFSATMTSKVVP